MHSGGLIVAHQATVHMMKALNFEHSSGSCIMLHYQQFYSRSVQG